MALYPLFLLDNYYSVQDEHPQLPPLLSIKYIEKYIFIHINYNPLLARIQVITQNSSIIPKT